MPSPFLSPTLLQLHPFHLVTPSPSPLLTAFQLGALATLAVGFFQSMLGASLGLMIALTTTSLLMGIW